MRHVAVCVGRVCICGDDSGENTACGRVVLEKRKDTFNDNELGKRE